MSIKKRALIFFALGIVLHGAVLALFLPPAAGGSWVKSPELFTDFPVSFFYIMAGESIRTVSYIVGGLYWGFLLFYGSLAIPALIRFAWSDRANFNGLAVQIFFALLAMALAAWAIA